jgi:hypothetical protein
VAVVLTGIYSTLWLAGTFEGIVTRELLGITFLLSFIFMLAVIVTTPAASPTLLNQRNRSICLLDARWRATPRYWHSQGKVPLRQNQSYPSSYRDPHAKPLLLTIKTLLTGYKVHDSI